MKKKVPKVWRYIVLLIVLYGLYVLLWWWKITPDSSVYVKKWDSIQVFFDNLSVLQRVRTKFYIMKKGVDTKKIQTGTYLFSWSYSPGEYIQTILKWPTQEYIRYTMLEWWSVYDVDADMAKKWLITAGEFLQYVTDSNKIQDLSETYAFLKQNKPLVTLEWFLYPDTYFLSTNGDTVPQFIQASLKRFREKVIPLWETYKGEFTNRVGAEWLTISLVGAVNIASIIEKEERALSEKSTIAGVFLNRLSQNIQLGADITLCYGRKEPYETCTPSIIAAYVRDETNQYNTRVFEWLPPTPISSITSDTFNALMNFKKTPYLFYLHDSAWKIHYAETNAQHEDNKKQYLQ